MSYSFKDLICRGNITLEIVDDFVLYKADLVSSIGNIFRNKDVSTDVTLIVFKGLDDITERFTDIEWKRFTFKSNGVEDKTWGDKHKGKRTITINREEIEGKAVIQCAVYSQMNGERTLVAAQSITFIDVNDLTPSAKPPSDPIDGEIWIDNSVDPPVIKVWDDKKKQWITITSVGGSTKNLINNSNFFKGYSFINYTLTGRLHDYRIAPYQGKKYAQIRADYYDNEKRGFYQDIKKDYFPNETYLYQAKAYILDQTGMYDGGLTLEVCDVTTTKGPNLEIIEHEETLGKQNFKLKNNEVTNIFFTFKMPQKITKLRAYVYGEPSTVFHIAITDLSISHNSKIHEWQLSDDDMEWKLNNKVNNDPKDVFQALTDNGKMQGIYTAINPETNRDDYYINANYIKSGQVEAEYINAKGLTVSKDIVAEDGTQSTIKTLEVTKDGSVHILADKLSIRPAAETNISTKDEVDNKLVEVDNKINTKVDANKDAIVNAINDTGMFIENGKLTLNADNVSTGILKSRNNVSVLNLNAGTFRLGNSDEFYKLKFDGENLLFGQGAIKWENLDNTVVEALTPYDAYLEKTSVIVTDEINKSVVAYAANAEIIIPENKPTNKVLAVKGNNKLTAVDTNPKDGEFSFRILEQNGCTAIKYSPSEFYIDKVNKENSYVKISISCENKQILTRTMTITMSNVQGSTGPQGDPGPAGDVATFIYCKSKQRPDKPTGNNPAGWYERIEDIIEQGDLWCSQGVRAGDTGLIKGEWQMPYKLEAMVNNLLANYPWTIGTGKCGIYEPLSSDNENIRTNDKDPKGNQSIVWTAISQDANGVTEFIDGGFTASVKIDPTKTYRMSVWVKVSDINCYINMLADITNTNDLNGAQQPNPTFVSTTLPEKDKWYLIVGYVLGSGNPHVPTNSGIYDSVSAERIVINGKEHSLPTFKNKDDATKQSIRVYMSGGETVGVNAKFFDPRIELIDGEEKTLDSLLGKMTDMKWIYEWNGTKTEINGSSILTPKLFTGTIDSTTGLHTGIAMGMNVLGDEKNGIVGYSKGLKTFHIRTDGSAVFGDETKDHIDISNDGTLTLPIVKGDRIQANKLVVKLLDGQGNPVLDKDGKEINTLEVKDNGEVIMHPSKFELLSDLQGGGKPQEGDPLDSLLPNLRRVGFTFVNVPDKPPQFIINATNITSKSIEAEKLSLYGLAVKRKSNGNETNIDTLSIDQNGEVSIDAKNLRVKANSFRIDTGNGEDSLNGVVSSIVMDQNTIQMIANKISIKGVVTFSKLEDVLSGGYTDENDHWHRTVIDGGCITTGTIRCNQIGAASAWGEAKIKLFDTCELDAMQDGIRLKWDDLNYIRTSANNIAFFLNGVHGSYIYLRNGQFFLGNRHAGMVMSKDQSRIDFIGDKGSYCETAAMKHISYHWGNSAKTIEGQIDALKGKSSPAFISEKDIAMFSNRSIKNYEHDIGLVNVVLQEDIDKFKICLDCNTPSYILDVDEDNSNRIDLLSLSCLSIVNIQQIIEKNKTLEQRIVELENKINGGVSIGK